jgi:hypothetical protein
MKEGKRGLLFRFQFSTVVMPGNATQRNEKSRQRFAGGFEIMTPSAP